MQQLKQQLLNDLYEPYKNCTGCHFNMPPATQIVFGKGNPNAKLLIIGEAPGAKEDLAGLPFVGRSGKLLDTILIESGIKPEDVYITNTVKCRPPENRKPLASEIKKSKSLLLKQIDIIKPTIICTLGSSALESLINYPIKMTQYRGKTISWHNYTLLATYHPAFILRKPSMKPIFSSDIALAISLCA